MPVIHNNPIKIAERL